MSEEGSEQAPPVQMDAMDRAALSDAQMDYIGNVVPWGNDKELHEARQRIAEVEERAAKKAELADAMSAGTRMRVDPAEVDGLAQFFEDEAEGLRDRERTVYDLSTVEPPGSDPTSQQVAQVFAQVGAGDEKAYLENYTKLIKVFEDTAANLRASAKQARTDDQNAEDSFRGGDLA